MGRKRMPRTVRRDLLPPPLCLGPRLVVQLEAKPLISEWRACIEEPDPPFRVLGPHRERDVVLDLRRQGDPGRCMSPGGVVLPEPPVEVRLIRLADQLGQSSGDKEGVGAHGDVAPPPDLHPEEARELCGLPALGQLGKHLRVHLPAASGGGPDDHVCQVQWYGGKQFHGPMGEVVKSQSPKAKLLLEVPKEVRRRFLGAMEPLPGGGGPVGSP
jgi:hypothetical protein